MTTLLTDFADAAPVYNTLMEKYTKNKKSVFGTPIALDVTGAVDFAWGGKSVNFGYFDLVKDSDETALEAEKFVSGTALTKGKMKQTLNTKAVETLAISASVTSQAERLSLKTITSNLYSQMILSASAKLAQKFDKYLLAEVVANGAAYTRLATDDTYVNTLIAARQKLGDACLDASYICVNAKTHSKMISESLAAYPFSGNLSSGAFGELIGCTVQISESVPDDVAILGAEGSVYFTMSGWTVNEVKKEGFETVYESSVDVCAYIPAENGVKKVVYVTLTPVAAG